MKPKLTQDFGGGVYLQDMEWVVIAVGVTICLVTTLCWWLLHDNKKEEMRRGKIPKGSFGWPIIGETLDFISSGYYTPKPPPLTFLEKRKSLYGNVFKSNIMGSNVIVSTEVEVNTSILVNQGNIFAPAYPKSIRELTGDYSIFQMNGTLHRNMHALIISFFRSPHLKARITSHIQRSVKHCLLSWKDATPQNPIYVQDQVKMITFPVLVKVLMSVSGDEELKLLKKDFQEFFKGFLNCLPIKFPGTTLYKSLKAKERMVKMVKRIMEERMHKNTSTSDEENDLVDVMLKHDWNPKPTLEMMCSNIVELITPGEETVPSAMTIAIFFLSNSPLALSKLREENMELKKHKSSTDNKYAWTDYMSLPFTQNVISETLRMANLVNGVWRKAQKDVEIKGYLIPKGWSVMACFTSVHLDSNNYENPFKFDPWRWEKIGAAASNNCYVPFGGGQRLCPGWELSRLELAIFLHHLVTTYRWVADRDEVQYFPTVKLKRKLPIISVQPINA